MPTKYTPLPQPKTLSGRPKKKRCANDGALFAIDARFPWQKFCSDGCRKEFHKHGSAFGPLRQTLEKLIEARVKELVPAAVAAALDARGVKC